MTRTVQILLFDAVELLDFAGPFEVFSVAGREGAFAVQTVAEAAAPLRSRGGLTVTPDATLAEAPQADVLVVPGGQGARTAMHRAPVLDWVRDGAETATVVLSVCTGAFILARAGLLDGCTVTTHRDGLDRLETLAPGAEVVRDRRFVDNGAIVTAAGIAAGIDAALHVVARLCGTDHAAATARHMEYASDGAAPRAPSGSSPASS
ncbi:MAG: DJ-1/PfpI family protein [Bacteroidetes bacterium]|jgi:transcriptional regulator GlxA family with amidase domain|nr:DJ-1/PfpI family protein [Bacteroidota bacterium]